MAETIDPAHTLQGIEHRLYQQISQKVTLEPTMQHLVKIAALTSVHSQKLLQQAIEEALDAGVSAAHIQECIYQGMPYAGLGLCEDAEAILQDIMQQRGITIEQDAGTVTDANRFDEGFKQQTAIFGEDNIRAIHNNAPADSAFLQVDLLTGWCFGDPYTRKVLTLQERELLTFCFITALGGNWPQVQSHVGGNLNMHNGRQTLIDCITVMVPVIGFPKALNALTAVNALAPAQAAAK